MRARQAASLRESLVAAGAEIFFPAFGEGGDGQSFFEDGEVVGRVMLRDVEVGDGRQGNADRVAGDEANIVAGGDFAFARDGHIKTRAAAGQEALGHLVVTEPYAELVTGKARLGDHNLRGADGEAVAEMDRIFEEVFALGSEILAELAQGKFAAGKFGFPEGVVFEGVAVDGLVFSAVDSEVGLAVTIQIQFAEGNAALDGLLENSGGDDPPVPFDFAG